MAPFFALGRALTSWYALALLVAGIGVATGLLIFTFLFPGQPKIGVIHIPFTAIEGNSAYVITEYLNHARRDDSIKAVVIRLTSPGGGAASSERLYSETSKLRAEKPVVLVMNDLVASGGYMMAMGASHLYATPSTLVGNVGVVSFVGPLIPSLPEEAIVASGPYKLSGSSRRDWIGSMNQLKVAFADVVVAERRGKLRMSAEELMEARIYTGADALILGLVDEIGTDADAFQKASELAGISNYGLVDVNVEVQRKFAQDLARIIEPLTGGTQSSLSQVLAIPPQQLQEEDLLRQIQGTGASSGVARLQTLRELAMSGIRSTTPEDPLDELPYDLNHPKIYYLYLGYDP